MNKKIQEMAGRVMHEILLGYQNDYFDRTKLKESIEGSSYEIIVDWAGLCTSEEYYKVLEDPNIYKNIYDEAFDRGVKAALAIILG